MSETPPATPTDTVEIQNVLKPAERHVSPAMIVTFAAVFACALVAVFLIFRYADIEHARGLREWQGKLNLIADSRVKDVDDWIDAHFKDIRAVADNPSMQLYATELQSTQGDRTQMSDEPAQAVFLRNLLIDVAHRGGFEDTSVLDAGLIDANVSREGRAGVAIVDNNGKVIAATPDMPPVEGELAAKILAGMQGTKSMIDMERLSDGAVRMGFMAPIRAIQSEDQTAQVGAVVGLKLVDDSFYSLLKHPGAIEQTLEAILVRKDGDTITYLSPLKDGSAPLAKSLPYDPVLLSAAFAIEKPGQFETLDNYASRKTISTGRQVTNAPWTLVMEIGEKEALAESRHWAKFMVTIFLLMLSVILIALTAVWHYATSKRAIDLSKRMAKLAAQTAEQERLLRVVTDNQPEPIFIVDSTSRYWFANKKAAEESGISIADMMGKMMGNVIGPGAAQKYIDSNKEVLATGKAISRVSRVPMENEAGERVIRSEHIPLARIPIESLPAATQGVLIIDQDITAVVSERERRMRILKQLIETLVTLVDRRDPFASHHSQHVARIARSVAIDMALEPVIIETAETAGNLMNIGKIAVSSDLLTKKAKLNHSEIEAIRDSMTQSADLLQNIEFDGPVVDTLRQSQEHWDGTGPLKLKGDNILVTARIIAVANTFVGMISPRSHRAAISIDETTKHLLAEIDTKYDRKVVVALINYLENRGGRAYLSKMMSAPSAA